MAAPPAATVYNVPDDGNEEQCGACGLPGSLLCCESCPAAYHAECAGYADEHEVPDGEWYCWGCARSLDYPFQHPSTPLRTDIGSQVLVATSEMEPDTFYHATVTALTDAAVAVSFGQSYKDATETFRRTSPQLWHGSMDTSRGWTPASGGGFRPNARAFAVDHERVVPSGSQRSSQAAGPEPSTARAGGGAEAASARQQHVVPAEAVPTAAVRDPQPAAQPFTQDDGTPALPSPTAQAAAPTSPGIWLPSPSEVSTAAPDAARSANAGSSQPALKRQTSSGARPRGRPPKLLRRERRDKEDDDGEAWRPRKETQRSRSEQGKTGPAKAKEVAPEPWIVPTPLPRPWRLNTSSAETPGDSRKVKADGVPAPPMPPKQRRMVGPLRPSLRGQLVPGDMVEVRQLARGCRGSWRLAKVKQVAKGSVAEGCWRYMVEYPRWTVSDDAARPGATAPAGEAFAATGAAAAGPAARKRTRVAGTPQAPGERAAEWIALLSRSTTDANPRVLLRRPRAGHVPVNPAFLQPGFPVEAMWGGAWWECMIVAINGEDAVRVRSLPEPDGENEVWDSAVTALRSPDPSAAQGFGMTEPMGASQHIPLEQYRNWLRPGECRCENFPVESYACAEQLPSSYTPPASASALTPLPTEDGAGTDIAAADGAAVTAEATNPSAKDSVDAVDATGAAGAATSLQSPARSDPMSEGHSSYQSAEGSPTSGVDVDHALVFEDDVVLPSMSLLATAAVEGAQPAGVGG